MPRDAGPGGRRRNEAVPVDSPALDALGEVIEDQLADLVDYCRALTGEDSDAVSTAHAVMDSAHSLLSDPEGLRAWLFALARRRAMATGPAGGGRTDSPQSQELLDLVHRHGIRPQDLPVVLGIPATDAAERLAAAEAERGSRSADQANGDSDRGSSNGWHDGSGWDGWAERDDRTGRHDDGGTWFDRDATGDSWADRDAGEGSDGGHPDDRDRLDDLEGLMRTPPESGGRHAARRFGGTGAWRALATGRVRLAVATAVVVAVIGVGAAYLAESGHPAQTGQAGLESSHHPSPAAQSSPASTPSPSPTTSPKHSASPSKSVTVVQPPPAPTSTKPKPKPSPTPSSSSPSSPASPSASASASSPGKAGG